MNEAITKLAKKETPQEIIIQPAFDPDEDIKRATQAAQALMKVVERTKPLILGGKKYLYFEHWQTIGQFFNHSVGIDWTKPIMQGEKVIGFEAKAVLFNGNGLIVGGAEAACMAEEKNWSNKPLFQLRSMAQTRAMAKALRSRFGFIPVLVGIEATPAEEMNMTEPFVGNEFNKIGRTKVIKKISNLQAKKIFELAKKWVRTKEEVKDFVISHCEIVFDNWNDLTSIQASEIIDKLLVMGKEEKGEN